MLLFGFNGPPLLFLLNARLVKCFCPVAAGQIRNRSYAMYDLPLPLPHTPIALELALESDHCCALVVNLFNHQL